MEDFSGDWRSRENTSLQVDHAPLDTLDAIVSYYLHVVSQFLEACIERQPDILLNEMRDQLWEICSISYLKAAQVTGSLFQENCDSGVASSVFTGFFVDNAEPLEALEQYKAMGSMMLG